MKKINLLFLGIFIALGNAEAANSASTVQVYHQKPTFAERNTPVPLTFEVPGLDSNDVQEAYLFYRLEGEIAFQQKKAVMTSSGFEVQISVEDRQATGLEYYFEIRLHNGEKITYPQNNASEDPVWVEVVDQRKSETQRRVEETGVDYTILSPDPGSAVGGKDVVVALTLFYEESEIGENTSFRMFVDGRDVTDRANASDFFYTYAPDDLPGGEHRATFKVEKSGTLLTIAEWDFTVINGSGQANPSAAQNGWSAWKPQGNVEFTARSQQVGGYANDALSGNLRLSGQKGDISYSAFGLLTTQEDPRLQPQNRYGVNFYVGDWLEFEAGHVYPTLNSFTIAGQRMQGINAGFHLWDDVLNMQLVYGKLRRGTDNLYEAIEVEEVSFEGSQNQVSSFSLNTQSTGTFRRKVRGGRLGLGKRDRFNFGLNFLKVEDDTSSVELINNFQDLMDANPTLASNLSDQQMQELQNNPNRLGVNGNPSPKGNFVAASDFLAHLDNNRIQFETDIAVSLLNQDISEGILTQETAGNLGLDLGDDVENLLDQLSWLIIINENMDTLPIRFDTNGSETSAEAFFPTNILATQSELGLSYFNNDLSFRYRWVGPSYNSLANTTVRKDIAGFNISDRFRMLENRIYVTVGYENLNDNVVDSKDATTNTVTYRGNVSWYPVDQDLPRVSLGLMKRNRDNEVGLYNPVVAGLNGIPESAAVQNLAIQNADTLTTPNPRLSDTYQFTASVSQRFSLLGITHNANLNYSFLNTSDQVFYYGDSRSNSFSLGVSNRYHDLPLQTNIGFNINSTETAGGLTDIHIMGVNLGGSMFFLDDKLSLDMTLAFTRNSSESLGLITDDNNTPQETADDFYTPGSSDGDISVSENNSFMINLGARYNVSDQHSFLANFRYSNIQNTFSSVSIPNDHLLQVRYIFNF